MSAAFLAEIRMFACNFAPVNWALCNGQILPISQNPALFSLLGVTYGGNGTSNFALPNLQGAVPIHFGQGPGLTPRELGENGGVPTVTLLQTELPAHNHSVIATTTTGTTAASTNNQLALASAGGKGSETVAKFYSSNSNSGLTAMAPAALGMAGANQPHNNFMPSLGLNFCIALQGVFPPRS